MASEPEHMRVVLPHRCLELRGTPPHWAVMAGYTDLVAAFIHLGADVNARNQWHINPDEGLHYPSLSLLDLAVNFHFPQIVQILLDHGGDVYGGDHYWKHSPFHMIGYHIFPFARYMAHGQGHRAAIQKTIQILVDRGLDINTLDSLGQTSLFVAVKNVDLEPYILEELLSAGAVARVHCEKQEGSLVASAVIGCAHRRLSSWKIPLLLPHVRDINACAIGEKGFNALHYCAIFDAVPAADILLRTPEVDVDAATGDGRTAVGLAAMRGSLGVLDSLIRKGAYLDLNIVLASAVSAGQIDAAIMLFNAAAGNSSQSRDRARSAGINMLYYSVRRDSKRPSYVRTCLAKCPQLRVQSVLDDCNNPYGTPLHQAAYYGDIDGVRALLEAGADPQKLSNAKSFGGLTPLERATKLVDETQVAPDGTRIFLTHPCVRREIDELPQTHDYLARSRRIEMRFMDALSGIIDMLRRAELERPLKESAVLP